MIFEKLNIEVLGVFKSWSKGIKATQKLKPDFLVIDIFLKDNENGLDMIEKSKLGNIPFIVCTGYPKDKFLNRALQLGVVSFFSKPIDKAAFKFELKSLQKRLIENEKGSFNLIIKDGRNRVKLLHSNISYIMVEGNYTTVVTEDQKKYVAKKSLTNFLAELDNEEFCRIHRGTVVNIRHIASLNLVDKRLSLRNGKELSIGNLYKDEVNNKFQFL
jgi:two-component system LytT family response regulator